jgi:ABC-type bacteriocin/lantibiotic exporter with double-glycine peptidase domain
MNGIKFLLGYFWNNSKMYVIYTILSQLFISSLPLLSIVLPKYIIDELVGQQNIEKLVMYVSILVFGNFLGSILANYFKNKSFVEKSKLFILFQTELTENLAKADYEKIESKSFLDLKEKAPKVLYGNGQGFAVVFENFVSIIGNIFVFAGILGILSMLDFRLIILFVVLIGVNAWIEQKSKQKFVALDIEKAPIERKTNYFISLIESFQYGKEIRLYNLTEWLMDKVKKQLTESNNFYEQQLQEVNKAENFNSFTTLLREAITFAFLIFQVMSKKITIGNFTMYVAAVSNFSAALRDVLDSITNIRQFEGYFDSLEEYLMIPRKMYESSGDKIPQGDYRIEFKNVTFRYPNQTKDVLTNISFTIKQGEKLAIVGENGAGKTTLVKLICRLYDPTEGNILLNDIDIRKFSYEDYMKIIATVFQDFKLFSFELKENIAFNQSDIVSDAEIITLLEQNGFGEKLNNLDRGIHTPIFRDFYEDGFEPSGGEAQKIALARADFKGSPIIILDEPTAAMDPKSEFELYQRFNTLVEGKAAIFITHRLASTRFCDNINLLKKGTIVELGNHKSLLEKSGEYATLYNMQAQFYNEDVIINS